MFCICQSISRDARDCPLHGEKVRAAGKAYELNGKRVDLRDVPQGVEVVHVATGAIVSLEPIS